MHLGLRATAQANGMREFIVEWPKKVIELSIVNTADATEPPCLCRLISTENR